MGYIASSAIMEMALSRPAALYLLTYSCNAHFDATVEGLSMTVANIALCMTGLWYMPVGFTLAANDEAVLLVSPPGNSSDSGVQDIAVMPRNALSIGAPEAAGYHCSL